MSRTEQIEISINSSEQLFNSYDPAPFRERELDPNAERYIISAGKKIPLPLAIELLIHLPAQQISEAAQRQIEQAIQHHFQLRAEEQAGDIAELAHLGRKGLLFGFMVMLLCTLLSIAVMNTFPSSNFASTLEQSLVIFGWVALWRPIEVLLYDRWPLARTQKLLQRLSHISVVLQATPVNPMSSAPA
jgi:hypothetical protein